MKVAITVKTNAKKEEVEWKKSVDLFPLYILITLLFFLS